MGPVSGTSLSGMRAAWAALGTSAHNIANLSTDGFRRQGVVNSTAASGGVTVQVTQSETIGPSLETDMVAQLQAKNDFLAHLAVFRTSDKMAGALLDLRA